MQKSIGLGDSRQQIYKGERKSLFFRNRFMCGIAGFINAPAPIEQQRLWIDSMAQSLAHRGPDSHGIWVEGQVALGHRRLSIIDLESGQQPMTDAEERAVIVFNGEIYNFKEIRARLEHQGH